MATPAAAPSPVPSAPAPAEPASPNAAERLPAQGIGKGGRPGEPAPPPPTERLPCAQGQVSGG